MSSPSDGQSVDYTQQHAEIAAKYGFRLTKEAGNLDFYRKDNEDGSFLLASTSSQLPFNLAPPDSHIWFIGRFTPSENGEARVVVHEALPIEVHLAEAQYIPTPVFDNDGDPLELDFMTWSDVHWNGRKGKPSWDKFEKVTRSIPGMQAMFDAGFHLTTTGGGCTAFEKFDEETETVWIVAAESSVDAHPLSLEWGISRCRNSERADESIGVSSTTIPEIIARYHDIPVPEEGQEEHYWYFANWDRLDEHFNNVGPCIA
jgi:hypothetical protein